MQDLLPSSQRIFDTFALQLLLSEETVEWRRLSEDQVSYFKESGLRDLAHIMAISNPDITVLSSILTNDWTHVHKLTRRTSSPCIPFEYLVTSPLHCASEEELVSIVSDPGRSTS